MSIFDTEKIKARLAELSALPPFKPSDDEPVFTVSHEGATLTFVVRDGEMLFFDAKQFTIRTLTSYQVEQLAGMFSGYIVEKIGRVDETRDLIVEYRGGDGLDGVMKTKSIPPFKL